MTKVSMVAILLAPWHPAALGLAALHACESRTKKNATPFGMAF
jgi:hypothetical protein